MGEVEVSSPLQTVNNELAMVVQKVRRSLVQVRNGHAGVGAGTIWHMDGLILTNAHVLQRRNLQVVLPEGETLPARILAHDSELDLAALGVDGSGLPTIELGDSRQLRPGQWVLALGHPWGVAGAATAGVVSGVGRRLPEMPKSDKEWIAASLHLRPGHSGGPLVDAGGRLVGINTIMAGPRVGLAVPVHVVKAFLRRAVGTT
jgi:S1-C subfamily serine protease